MDHYSVNVVWGEEDECFIATIPEFEGLSAHGDTQEEAILEARIALKGFIEVMEEDGEKIPEPNEYNSFSGQTRIRIPKSLHRDLSIQAQEENVSLNTLIVKLLSERNIVNKFAKDIEYLKIIQDENIIKAFEAITESSGTMNEETTENIIQWPIGNIMEK